MAEFRRSLQTKDASVARRRCLEATAWFRSTMEQLREMPSPTKRDFEEAARRYFDQLNAAHDGPRDFHPDRFEEQVGFNIDASRTRILELDHQLLANEFDSNVRWAAERLAEGSNTSFGELSEAAKLDLQKLAARTLRAHQQVFIHGLTAPATVFVHTDKMFEPAAGGIAAEGPDIARNRTPPTPLGPSLEEAVRDYLRHKERGVGLSQLSEIKRALEWLKEEAGPEARMDQLSKPFLRKFRDDIGRIDVTLRGRALPLSRRLTNVSANAIQSATAMRYWKSVQAFLAWCSAEGLAEDNQSVGLAIAPRRDQQQKSPDPFDKVELQRLLSTPLFKGCKSLKRLKEPGDCHLRGARWWSGSLSLYTGLRAGELSQLLPSDFEFEAEVPHLHVRETDDRGARVKSTKTVSSTRDVPLHRDLLKLGLRQFVEARQRSRPRDRVFLDFRLGTGGHRSDGMSKFWSDYVRHFGLWKPGRATHVFRHTVVACLRSNDVSDEDIAAVLGHKGRTMTSRYGGVTPLSRKLKTIEHLDYGFDPVEVLGGAYDPRRHGA